jgi:RHS repeat-associated protein
MPVVLRDSAGNRYLYGLDLISVSDSANKKFYYHTDGLGSTTAITGSTGAVVKTYQYDAYGAVRTQTGTQPNEFTFTGEQVDSSGLQYLRARYYDGATGRFVGRDPLPLLQRYSYAGANPVNFTDPLGLFGPKDIKNGAKAIGRAISDGAREVGGSLIASPSYLCGVNPTVCGVASVALVAYQTVKSGVLDRFMTLDCLGLALDLGANAALAVGGPVGVPVAAGLFAVGVGIDASQSDYEGTVIGSAAWWSTAFSFAKSGAAAPAMRAFAQRVGAVGLAYSVSQCVNSALQ